MQAALWHAITTGLTCDITTRGRKSGKLSRIEIWYFVVDQQIYLSGTPGKRDWYANLLVEPQCTFHVKEGAHADLAATAEAVLDPAERRPIMAKIIASQSYFQDGSLDQWVAESPLMRLILVEKNT